MVGMSAEGLRLIEIGESTPRPATAVAIAKALQWPPDALDRLANGEDPASFETVEPAPEPHEVGRLDWMADEIVRLRGQVAELAQLLRQDIEGRSKGE